MDSPLSDSFWEEGEEMTVLVTGAGGMVGSHMVEILDARGVPVVGSYYSPTVNMAEIDPSIEMVELDVSDEAAVRALVERIRPERIFHLAAQSYPTVSWEKPRLTFDVNAGGTIAVFEAVKALRREDPAYDPMVVVACSSAEYGKSIEQSGVEMIDESTPLLPLHPYGVSKVAQDLLSYQYFQNDGTRCIRARIFNTTGPRKVNDVTSDFTRRAIEQELAGAARPRLRVGNVNTRRAIMDVRDLIEALLLLSERGRAGEAYNISAESAVLIADIISMIEADMGVRFELDVDPALIRPTDEAIILGDTAKLRADTGWAPTRALADTVHEMLAYWRRALG